MIKIIIFAMLSIYTGILPKTLNSPKTNVTSLNRVSIKPFAVGDIFIMENKIIIISNYKILVCENGECYRMSRKSKDKIIDCLPEKLNPLNNGSGYLRFNINKTTVYVHRLVSMAFISNAENKPHVNHKNGIKADNRVENLEWCTSEENNNHARITGLTKQNGEDSVLSILSNEDVLNIFKSTDSCRKLAIKYNTSSTNISCIRVGKSWSHLTGKIYEKRH